MADFKESTAKAQSQAATQPPESANTGNPYADAIAVQPQAAPASTPPRNDATRCRRFCQIPIASLVCPCCALHALWSEEPSLAWAVATVSCVCSVFALLEEGECPTEACCEVLEALFCYRATLAARFEGSPRALRSLDAFESWKDSLRCCCECGCGSKSCGPYTCCWTPQWECPSCNPCPCSCTQDCCCWPTQCKCVGHACDTLRYPACAPRKPCVACDCCAFLYLAGQSFLGCIAYPCSLCHYTHLAYKSGFIAMKNSSARPTPNYGNYICHFPSLPKGSLTGSCSDECDDCSADCC